MHTDKDMFRSTCQGVPYKRITKIILQSLVEGIIDILNAFPSNQGISNTLGSPAIVESKPKLDLRAYTKISNDMKARAIPAISLRMSNSVGGIIL